MKKQSKVVELSAEGLADFNWDELEEPKAAIKRRTKAAANLESISEAFSLEYPEVGKVDCANDIAAQFEIYPGKFIYVTVDDITIAGLKLSAEGIKERIVNKNNFRDYPGFRSYLLQNNNRIIGLVKEVKENEVVVDVMEAYYRIWLLEVEEYYIKKETPIQITDLELTRGGFLGKVNIWTLEELTGEKWINTCFIPGSQIVLNVEQNFDKWVGESVTAIPQKFTVFSTIYQRQDNCLVCSRKKLLSYEGAKNLEELYNRMQLLTLNKDNKYTPTFDGVVTGVIRTNNVCGVFVELADMNITGILPCETFELAGYVNGSHLQIQIDKFEATSEKIFNKNANGNIQWPNMRVFFKQMK